MQLTAHRYHSFCPKTRAARATALVFMVLAITGCASTFRVDSEVQSYARWPQPASADPQAQPPVVPAAPQTYQFDRLPSQQQATSAGPSPSQAMLEAAASNSLMRHGWTAAADATPARWLVQISGGTVVLARAPLEDPWDPWGSRFGIGIGGRGGHVWTSFGLHGGYSPYYVRKVSVLIRDRDSGKVVYETHATHDGRWNDTTRLWQTIMDAALDGFPVPPAGPRVINTDLQR
ncbi:DUF4136 domain-containing protein [Hydrogenophaga sp. 5NK40-0174]|uniref:DUF4136 domain-containing protein n=1 Tax=Hydrogenophaga sp. 5NK40-0174 TaxID=3127649 RepID=UPI0031058FA8